MDSQASKHAEATTTSEPREAPRARHFHFRRRRVLWALGLEPVRETAELARVAS